MDVQDVQGEMQLIILLSLSVNLGILLCFGGVGVTGRKEKIGDCEKILRNFLSQSLCVPKAQGALLSGSRLSVP